MLFQNQQCTVPDNPEENNTDSDINTTPETPDGNGSEGNKTEEN